MKSTLILAIFFFIFVNSFGQIGFTNKYEAKNETIDGLKQGRWIEYRNKEGDPCGQEKAAYYMLVKYKDDKKDELAREYDINDKLVAEYPFTNDVLNGTVRYYEKESLLSEYMYLNGMLNDTARGYYENGMLKYETPYMNGKQNGVFKAYYENGGVNNERYYRNDTLDGLSKVYFMTGNLSFKTPYVNGKLNGKAKYYYENGNLKCEKQFQDGLPEGICLWYFESGKIQSIEPFKKGKLHGIGKWFEENGNSGEQLYLEGIRYKLEFYETGELKNKAPLDNNRQKKGVDTTYYKNGSIKTTSTYKNGMKNGTEI